MLSTTTTVRSWPALALAVILAAATARVLLDDVFSGGPFTLTHVGSIAALIAALGAGHYAWPALRQGAIASGLILGLVFFGATAYVVVASGMRNAEQAAGKAATASKARDDRRNAETEWRRLVDELAAVGPARSTTAVRAAMDAAVGGREGQVPVRVFTATRQCTDITKPASAEACRPLLALRVEMAAAIRRAELEPKVAAARGHLEAMPAVVGPDTGYAYAGRVLAALPGITAPADAIAERLALIMPFLQVLIGEAGGLGFAFLAFGHKAPAPSLPAVKPATGAQREPRKPLPPKPAGPKGPAKRGRKSDPKVIDFAARFREKNGRAPGGSEIMGAFPGMPKSTAYDYAKRA